MGIGRHLFSRYPAFGRMASELLSSKIETHRKCFLFTVTGASSSLVAMSASSAHSMPEDSEGGIIKEAQKNLKKVQSSAEQSWSMLSDLQKRFNNGESPSEIASELVDHVIESGVGQQLSTGLVFGICSGFAVKKIGKLAAFVFGSGFCVLQGLSYSGYITLNYKKMDDSLKQLLDADGDGKFDSTDIQIWYSKMENVLTYNLPAGSGFTTGLVIGLRMG
uniref:EF-hand domain-containing protein n=1 Tax=Heterosigma akashiwo TaxID=2829 RepID=A0A7S3UWL8_HETAK